MMKIWTSTMLAGAHWFWASEQPLCFPCLAVSVTDACTAANCRSVCTVLPDLYQACTLSSIPVGLNECSASLVAARPSPAHPWSLHLAGVLQWAAKHPTGGVITGRQTCNKSSNSLVQIQVQVHLKRASPSPSSSPLQKRQVQVQ